MDWKTRWERIKRLDAVVGAGERFYVWSSAVIGVTMTAFATLFGQVTPGVGVALGITSAAAAGVAVIVTREWWYRHRPRLSGRINYVGEAPQGVLVFLTLMNRGAPTSLVHWRLVARTTEGDYTLDPMPATAIPTGPGEIPSEVREMFLPLVTTDPLPTGKVIVDAWMHGGNTQLPRHILMGSAQMVLQCEDAFGKTWEFPHMGQRRWTPYVPPGFTDEAERLRQKLENERGDSFEPSGSRAEAPQSPTSEGTESET